LYHSTLGLRVIKKKKVGTLEAIGLRLIKKKRRFSLSDSFFATSGST